MICNLQCELPYPFRYIYAIYTLVISHTHSSGCGVYIERMVFLVGCSNFSRLGGRLTDGWMDGQCVLRVVCWLRARLVWLLVA